jgi:hypothetical protein
VNEFHETVTTTARVAAATATRSALGATAARKTPGTSGAGSAPSAAGERPSRPLDARRLPVPQGVDQVDTAPPQRQEQAEDDRDGGRHPEAARQLPVLVVVGVDDDRPGVGPTDGDRVLADRFEGPVEGHRRRLAGRHLDCHAVDDDLGDRQVDRALARRVAGVLERDLDLAGGLLDVGVGLGRDVPVEVGDLDRVGATPVLLVAVAVITTVVASTTASATSAGAVGASSPQVFVSEAWTVSESVSGTLSVVSRRTPTWSVSPGDSSTVSDGLSTRSVGSAPW